MDSGDKLTEKTNVHSSYLDAGENLVHQFDPRVLVLHLLDLEQEMQTRNKCGAPYVNRHGENSVIFCWFSCWYSC